MFVFSSSLSCRLAGSFLCVFFFFFFSYSKKETCIFSEKETLLFAKTIQIPMNEMVFSKKKVKRNRNFSRFMFLLIFSGQSILGDIFSDFFSRAGDLFLLLVYFYFNNKKYILNDLCFNLN